MSITKTLGGDRLGSGKRQKVELHNYERSTHNLGYIWRSTMASGTLVPFMSEVMLPGDTFDIDLDCDIKTHPTIGPLFGSYKVQLDVFFAPVRLYQNQLHNNKLGIGMNMANVKLPIMQLKANVFNPEDVTDIDNAQINPSCILSYLGIRGVGLNTPLEENTLRNFNAIPLLAYWEIYKNYYANKQEEIGAFIHTPTPEIVEWLNLGGVGIKTNSLQVSYETLSQNSPETIQPIGQTGTIQLLWPDVMLTPDVNQIIFVTTTGQEISAAEIATWAHNTSTFESLGQYNYEKYGYIGLSYWRYITVNELPAQEPQVATFPLSNIDTMRERILTPTIANAPFNINTDPIDPYQKVLGASNGINHMLSTQEGLGLKTYQSDLFNNWLSTEWIDGPGGINEITAIDTTGGSFTMDTFLLSKKVYDMLNRIAVSGGSYNDWLDAVYARDRFTVIESPMYLGGLIKELVFQEVVSNSTSIGEQGGQPLGTLAGKGIMANKHKGGKIVAKAEEIGYLIGIISLTPRVDYSQGNKWDVHLETMDDFHKPGLDGIGFQETITEQMAWFSTRREIGQGSTWFTRSAGKQPAWINYMTNVNQTRGNFAIDGNEMFMTLNRRYEADPLTGEITDLTTYIDPKKFNNIFAQTSRDAQNFWAQISVDIIARRVMSAKVMPNL